MDIDLDDLISTGAANTAKAGMKFQPKGKPKHKPKPKANAQPEPKSTPKATTEELTANDANQIIGNVLGSLQSSFENPQNAELNLTLDSPDDFIHQSTTTVNMPSCSEPPTVDVSMDDKLKAGPPTESGLINTIDASSTNLEAAILNDNEEFQIGNLSPTSKEAKTSHLWEPADTLGQSITGSGPRVGKFKPKPKAQSRKMEQIVNNHDQNAGLIPHEENICSVNSQISFMENEPGPSFTLDEILGSSPDAVPTETISDNHVNEAGRSSKRVIKRTNKALQLIDEAENEGIDDNNNNDDYVPENESLIEKKGRKSKSKKPLTEKKNPVRKRKKATEEVANELVEVPKKKFSHTTKRNRRPVNPELLKIPEEEFELHMHNFNLRDLIRLREHKERIEKKEASLVGKDSTDQSDHAQDDATYYNYGTHMKTTARAKWTKLDTELFYEAVQQFGSDLSMITECFPGRTRDQIRAKFKRESKQHRLRIDSALSTRAKGHSHFEFVIERLKQARAEETENDEPVSLTGEEDDVVATDIKEGNDVGLQKEVKDMEPDGPPAAAAESPTESNDFEDDTWSNYKSEI